MTIMLRRLMVAWNLCPARTTMGPSVSGLRTSTEPSRSRRSISSASGSQRRSKRVPMTRTSNGPATNVQCDILWWATCEIAPPFSSSTRAPVAYVASTRIRVPASARTSEPSEKRTSTGSVGGALTYGLSTPDPPTISYWSGRGRSQSATLAIATAANANAMTARAGRRDGRFRAAAMPTIRLRPSRSTSGSTGALAASRASAPMTESCSSSSPQPITPSPRRVRPASFPNIEEARAPDSLAAGVAPARE